jgi:hypothetical protein
MIRHFPAEVQTIIPARVVSHADGTVRCPHCHRPVTLVFASGTAPSDVQPSRAGLLDHVLLLQDGLADLKAALERAVGL